MSPPTWSCISYLLTTVTVLARFKAPTPNWDICADNLPPHHGPCQFFLCSASNPSEPPLPRISCRANTCPLSPSLVPPQAPYSSHLIITSSEKPSPVSRPWLAEGSVYPAPTAACSLPTHLFPDQATRTLGRIGTKCHPGMRPQGSPPWRPSTRVGQEWPPLAVAPVTEHHRLPPALPATRSLFVMRLLMMSSEEAGVRGGCDLGAPLPVPEPPRHSMAALWVLIQWPWP